MCIGFGCLLPAFMRFAVGQWLELGQQAAEAAGALSSISFHTLRACPCGLSTWGNWGFTAWQLQGSHPANMVAECFKSEYSSDKGRTVVPLVVHSLYRVSSTYITYIEVKNSR